jgi:hypothetical protein
LQSAVLASVPMIFVDLAMSSATALVPNLLPKGKKIKVSLYSVELKNAIVNK